MIGRLIKIGLYTSKLFGMLNNSMTALILGALATRFKNQTFTYVLPPVSQSPCESIIMQFSLYHLEREPGNSKEMFKQDLAYRRKGTVNWCEQCQTVHHWECIQEAGGCTIFGCEGSGKRIRA